MSNLSSSSLAKLSVWKQSLRNKKAGLPLDPPYDTVHPYEAWSPEGRLCLRCPLERARGTHRREEVSPSKTERYRSRPALCYTKPDAAAGSTTRSHKMRA